MQNMRIPAFIAVVMVLSLASVVCASELSMGVKSGNWIEYIVTSTGAPMQGHDIEWARMEILGVENPNINVSITSRFTDGSNDTTTHTLNLETGQLIDDFIIPANLDVGDLFVDENLGNVTISKSETQTYAGAERTIVSSTVGNNTYVWDQATGVSVEGTSKTSEYTIHTIVSATNMWQPTLPQRFGVESLILLAAVLLLIIFLVIATTVQYLHKRTCQKRLESAANLD
jgi:hypothetical protein